MEYTIEEKYKLIKDEVLKQTSKNPIEIVKSIMHKDYINMHGAEHHFLDGASFMVAYKNAGGDIDLELGLETLAQRSIMMPKATCGQWGVCGSVCSLGATLSIIHDVGPLSNNGYYKDDMEFTSLALNKMSKIGGPRCCKRNAYISISTAVELVKNRYNIEMDIDDITCEFSKLNKQCIGIRCPYNKLHNAE